MSSEPTIRLLVGAAALAVLLGIGVAACQNQDDGPPADPCAGVAYAIPAGPIEGTKPSSRKNLNPPSSRVRKDPPRAVVTKKATPRPVPSVSKSRTSHGHHPHHEIDLDVDLDGC